MTEASSNEAQFAHLLEPMQLGSFEIPNRVKYAACSISNFSALNGHITDREYARMEVIAATGCGLITNQGAYTDPKGVGKACFRQLALYDDEFIPGFRQVAEMIKRGGGCDPTDSSWWSLRWCEP